MTSASLAYDRTIEALRATVPMVRANGTRATANCPAHHDSSPSLAVTSITGSVLIHCHAGCQVDDILDALHLTRGDLYDDPKGATYTYDDGRIVHRTPDKKFRQSGHKNGQAQLYRLSKVRTAIAAGQPIYLVEGEKDVAAMETLGVTATTTPMGAANFHRADISPLAGAHIIVVPDRDEAGKKYAITATSSLTDIAKTIEIRLPLEGKDAADHIAAGHTLEQLVLTPLDPVELEQPTDDTDPATRRITLTKASTIRVRRVRWLWEGRIAHGTLALLAGREGIGKSTIGYDLAARVTKGTLDGENYSHPHAVLIAATEDSWEHTIVPRLIAASANLDLVYRIEVETYDHLRLTLSLPRDYDQVEQAAKETEAALLILDPLMSTIDAKLDTHRDREVRQALEPLVAVADRARMSVIGLIHHNKSGATDALNLVMASKAFTAVARSVHTCINDPDDETETRKIFATSKNNLGRLDLPMLGYTITGHPIETEDDGIAWTGKIRWTGEIQGNVNELINRTADPEKGATADAASWLEDYLRSHGGEASKPDIDKAARIAGHSTRTVQRARERLKIHHQSAGFPRTSYWSLPGAVPEQPSLDSCANPDGTTAVVPSDANAWRDLAQLDLTSQNTNPEPSRAHARAQGDTLFGTTDQDRTSPISSVVPSRASDANPREVGTTERPPICPDCGWPVDSNGHANTCEDP